LSKISNTDPRGTPEESALWQQMMGSIPHGVALLDCETGLTLWNNTALSTLVGSALGMSHLLGLIATAYLPGLKHNDWENLKGQALQQAGKPIAPQRIRFVHQSTRNIGYWDWTVQCIASESDSPYLMLLVQNVGEIVMNERLLATEGRRAQRAQHRAESLVRLTQLVNASLTTPDLLRAVAEEAAAYFGSGHAAVLLLTRDGTELEVAYGVGLLAEIEGKNGHRRLPLGETPGGRALSKARTLVFNDLTELSLRTPPLEGGREPIMVISSPIKQGDKAYGVVEVYMHEVREISEESVSLLTAFAYQTAIALDKADLNDQIAEQGRQLQSIFDHAPVGIVYLSIDLNAVAVNQAAAVRYGASPAELTGRHYADFMTDIPAELLQNASEGVPYHASHYVYKDTNGEETVCDLSLLPVRTAKGIVAGLLLLTFDVSELVAAEQEADAARRVSEDALTEVRATQGQMVQVEKMRAVGELASGIAHQFNNSLMAILGHAELAEDELDDPVAVASYFETIKKVVNDAAETVHRLQRFAKQSTNPNGEATDLNGAVEDAIELARPRWHNAARNSGRLYDVRAELVPLPNIVAEPGELREVLLNMIYNALNAMPEGGDLVLRTLRYSENEVAVEIKDSGMGMTPETVSQIFDPFFTTRGVEGNGLGLSVSWTIIQRHGGTIEVESAPGEGTRFLIRLPLGCLLEPVAAAPLSAPRRATSGQEVLVVDDEPMVSSVLASILSREGYRVSKAANAAEALIQLRKNSNFSVVLTDHGMPGMTGLQLIAEIKRLYPALPTLLLTGWGASVFANSKPEVLPDAVLAKPIDRTDLLDALAKAMSGTKVDGLDAE